MRLGLFLTTLIGLAGASHISSAADATWVAVSTLENGTSPYCAGGQFTGQQVSLGQNDWQVDIKGEHAHFYEPNRLPFIHSRFEGVAA